MKQMALAMFRGGIVLDTAGYASDTLILIHTAKNALSCLFAVLLICISHTAVRKDCQSSKIFLSFYLFKLPDTKNSSKMETFRLYPMIYAVVYRDNFDRHQKSARKSIKEWTT